MKHRHFFIPIVAGFFLTACAGPSTIETTEVPMRPMDANGTDLSRDETDRLLYPAHAKNYSIGPRLDPNNPRIRHDAHDVQRIEQDATFNLHPNESFDTASGPVKKVADPADSKNPYLAELEQKLVQQRTYSRALMEQNDVLVKHIEEVGKKADILEKSVSENRDLHTKVAELTKTQGELLKRVQEEKSDQQKRGFWAKVIDLFQPSNKETNNEK